jgi:hypothetical protein
MLWQQPARGIEQGSLIADPKSDCISINLQSMWRYEIPKLDLTRRKLKVDEKKINQDMGHWTHRDIAG